MPEFDLIENKICSCGEPYQLTNGVLCESIDSLFNHAFIKHPEFAKEIIDKNCFNRSCESEAYQLSI